MIKKITALFFALLMILFIIMTYLCSCSSQMDSEEQPEIVIIDSMSGRYIEIPFLSEDQCGGLIEMLNGNPIDLQYSDFDSYEAFEEYTGMWIKEINSTIDSLCVSIGEEHRTALEKIAQDTYSLNEKKRLLEQSLLNTQLFGTAIRLGERDEFIDMYRQLLYQLKLWQYIINNKNAVPFSHTSITNSGAAVPTEDAASEITAVYGTDKLIIKTPFSPSYAFNVPDTFIVDARDLYHKFMKDGISNYTDYISYDSIVSVPGISEKINDYIESAFEISAQKTAFLLSLQRNNRLENIEESVIRKAEVRSDFQAIIHIKYLIYLHNRNVTETNR